MPALSVARPCPSVTSQGSIKTAQQIKLLFSTGIYNCLEQTRWALMQTMHCHQMFVWLEWETNANQL